MLSQGGKQISRQYVAGLFDGEGCVTFYTSKGYANPILVIAMTDRLVLEDCAERWGGRVHAFQSGATRMYHWRVFGARARTFARDILPFLRTKHREVEIVFPVLGRRGAVTLKREAKRVLSNYRCLRALGVM